MVKTLMKDIFAGVLTLVRVSTTSLVFLFIMATVAKADILHVPSEYSTIQAAIDAASGGDEVLAADNVYTGEDNKNLDFMGKAITVRSENGPEDCIIDCQGSGRGFYFHNGEGGSSVVKGFTIRNGYMDGEWPQDSGGAISCISSSPTIIENVIKDNFAIYSGGGIFCFDSASPVIQSNTLTGNSAFLGSGIYCFESSSPLIQNNMITENIANHPSGAGGGGISCSASSPTITSNTIMDNSASLGGGIDVYHYASPNIVNNVIVGNSASGMGGGVFCYDVSVVTIINNTIVGNSARLGNGIYCGHFTDLTVINTILWNLGNELYASDSSVTVTYSNVQGGYAGEGNIDAVPSFVSLRKGDYHLRLNSPCIGAGTNVGAPSFDKDGNPRPSPSFSYCDIGAYESRLGRPRGSSESAPAALRKAASEWGKIKQAP